MHELDLSVLGLCSALEEGFAIIEGVDQSCKDDLNWAYSVDHLLGGLLLVPPREVIYEEQRFALFMRKEPTWREGTFAAFVWRLQIQVIALLTFFHLYLNDLVDASGLQGDIDFNNPEWHAYNVQLALSHFKFARVFLDPPAMAICVSYTAPFMWLACMIVRGTRVNKLERIIELLESSNILGPFDHEGFRNRWPEGTELRKKPLSTTPHPRMTLRFKQLGFNLPMGILPEIRVENAFVLVLERYDLEWNLFKKFFRLDNEDPDFRHCDSSDVSSD